MAKLHESDIQWVIVRDDLTDLNPTGKGDLGVKIGDQIFTLYQEESLERSGLRYRAVTHHDFGDCVETNLDPQNYEWKISKGNDFNINVSALLPSDEVIYEVPTKMSVTFDKYLVLKIDLVDRNFTFSLLLNEVRSTKESRSFLEAWSRMTSFTIHNSWEMG